MAKPIKKKIENRIRKGAKSVEKSIGDIRPKKQVSKAKVAGMTGVAVAGVAGVAAAVHHLRKGQHDSATFHVRRNGDREWTVSADGHEEPIGVFETKKTAVKSARKSAAEAAPSDLVIHRSDGTVQESHSYERA